MKIALYRVALLCALTCLSPTRATSDSADVIGTWQIPSLARTGQLEDFQGGVARDLAVLEPLIGAFGLKSGGKIVVPDDPAIEELGELLARAVDARDDLVRFKATGWDYVRRFERIRKAAEALYDEAIGAQSNQWLPAAEARLVDAIELLARQAARAELDKTPNVLATIDEARRRLFADPALGVSCNSLQNTSLRQMLLELCGREPLDGPVLRARLQAFATAKADAVAARFDAALTTACTNPSGDRVMLCAFVDERRAALELVRKELPASRPFSMLEELESELKVHQFNIRRLIARLDASKAGHLDEIDLDQATVEGALTIVFNALKRVSPAIPAPAGPRRAPLPDIAKQLLDTPLAELDRVKKAFETNKELAAKLLPKGLASLTEASLPALRTQVQTAATRLSALEVAITGLTRAGIGDLRIHIVPVELSVDAQELRITAALELEKTVRTTLATGEQSIQRISFGLQSQVITIPVDFARPDWHTLLEQALAAQLAAKELVVLKPELDELFAQLTFPLGLPVDRASFTFARGLQIEVAGSCFTVPILVTPQDPNCPTLANRDAAATALVSALRRDLIAKVTSQASTALSALPLWSQQDQAAIHAKVKDALQKVPIACSRRSCSATIDVDTDWLVPAGTGTQLRIERDADGAVKVGIELGSEHQLAQLTKLPNLIIDEVIERSKQTGIATKVRVAARFADAVRLDLGEVSLLRSVTTLQLPADLDLVLGGGLRVRVPRGRVDIADGALQISDVDLFLPSPFDAKIESIDLALRATVEKSTLKTSLDAKGSSFARVAKKLAGGLTRAGLLPADVTIERWWLEHDGIHVKYNVPATFTAAERKTLEALELLNATTVGELAARKLDEVRALALAHANGLTQAALADIADACKAPPTSIVRIENCSKTGFAAIVDVPGIDTKLRVQVTRTPAGLKYEVSPVVATAWLTEWLATMKLKGIEDVDASVEASDPPRFKLKTKVLVNGDKLPIAVVIGLDGRVSVDPDLLRGVLDKLRAPIADAGKLLFEELAKRVSFPLPDSACKLANDDPAGEPTLVCAVTLPPADVKISNIRFRASSGLDLSAVEIDRSRLNAFLKKEVSPNLEITGISTASDRIEIAVRFTVKIPELDERPFEVDTTIVIDARTKNIDASVNLSKTIETVIKSRLLPWRYESERFSAELTSVELKGKTLELGGKVTVSAGIDLPMDVTLRVPLEDPTKTTIDFRQPDAGAVVEKLLGLISMPFFGKGELPRVEAIDLSGNAVPWYKLRSIPRSLRFTFSVPIWKGSLVVEGLEIDRKGVRDLRGVTFTLPTGLYIEPFVIAKPSATLSKDYIAVRGKLTIGEEDVQYIIHLDGEHTLNIGEIMKNWQNAEIKSTARLVLFSLFELGRSTSTISVKRRQIEHYISIGGVLSRLISVNGNVIIKMWGIGGEVQGDLLGVRMLDGKLDIDLKSGRVLIAAALKIPITDIRGRFSADEGFAHAAFRASQTLKIPVLDVELSSAFIEASLSRAKLGFTFLGVELALVVPGLADLTPDRLKKLLLRILAPDIAHLDRALMAILHGHFTINPFAGFGEGDGDVDGEDGDKPDGGKNGSGTGNAPDNRGGFEGLAASVVAEANKAAQAAAGTGTGSGTGSGTGTTGTGSVNAQAPLLHKAGEFTFPIRRNLVVNQEGNGVTLPLVYVKEKVGDTQQFQPINAAEYASVGKVLAVGTRYFAHVLDEEVPGKCKGVYYFFTSQSDAERSAARLPAGDIGQAFCFDQRERIADDAQRKLAFEAFLRGTAWALRGDDPSQLDAIRYIAEGDVRAFLVHHKGERFYRVYGIAGGEHAVLFPLWNGEEIASKNNADVAAIVRHVLTRKESEGRQGVDTRTGASLFSSGSQLFLIDQDSLNRVVNGTVERLESISWTPTWGEPLPTLAPTTNEEEQFRGRREKLEKEHALADEVGKSILFGSGTIAVDFARSGDDVIATAGGATLTRVRWDANWFTAATPPQPIGNLAIVNKDGIVMYQTAQACKTTIAWLSASRAEPVTMTVDACLDNLGTQERRRVWGSWVHATLEALRFGGNAPVIESEIIAAKLTALVVRLPKQTTWSVFAHFDGGVQLIQLDADPKFFKLEDKVDDALRAAHAETGRANIVLANGHWFVLTASKLLTWRTDAALATIGELRAVEQSRHLDAILDSKTSASTVLASFLSTLDVTQNWQIWVALRDFQYRNDAFIARTGNGPFRAVVATHAEITGAKTYPAGTALKDVVPEVIRNIQDADAKRELELTYQPHAAHFNDQRTWRCWLDETPAGRDAMINSIFERVMYERHVDISREAVDAALRGDAQHESSAAKPRTIIPGDVTDLLDEPRYLDSYLTLLAEKNVSAAEIGRRTQAAFVLAELAGNKDELWQLAPKSAVDLGDVDRHTEVRKLLFDAVNEFVGTPGWKPTTVRVSAPFEVTRLVGASPSELVYLWSTANGATRRDVVSRVGDAPFLMEPAFLKSLAGASGRVTVLESRCAGKCLFVLDGPNLEVWPKSQVIGELPALANAPKRVIDRLVDDLETEVMANKRPVIASAQPLRTATVNGLVLQRGVSADTFDVYAQEGNTVLAASIRDEALMRREGILIAAIARLAADAKQIARVVQLQRVWVVLGDKLFVWRDNRLAPAGSTTLGDAYLEIVLRALERMKPDGVLEDSALLGNAKLMRLRLKGLDFDYIRRSDGSVVALRATAADLDAAVRTETLDEVVAALSEVEPAPQLIVAGSTSTTFLLRNKELFAVTAQRLAALGPLADPGPKLLRGLLGALALEMTRRPARPLLQESCNGDATSQLAFACVRLTSASGTLEWMLHVSDGNAAESAIVEDLQEALDNPVWPQRIGRFLLAQHPKSRLSFAKVANIETRFFVLDHDLYAAKRGDFARVGSVEGANSRVPGFLHDVAVELGDQLRVIVAGTEAFKATKDATDEALLVEWQGVTRKSLYAPDPLKTAGAIRIDVVDREKTLASIPFRQAILANRPSGKQPFDILSYGKWRLLVAQDAKVRSWHDTKGWDGPVDRTDTFAFGGGDVVVLDQINRASELVFVPGRSEPLVLKLSKTGPQAFQRKLLERVLALGGDDHAGVDVLPASNGLRYALVAGETLAWTGSDLVSVKGLTPALMRGDFKSGPRRDAVLSENAATAFAGASSAQLLANGSAGFSILITAGGVRRLLTRCLGPFETHDQDETKIKTLLRDVRAKVPCGGDVECLRKVATEFFRGGTSALVTAVTPAKIKGSLCY